MGDKDEGHEKLYRNCRIFFNRKEKNAGTKLLKVSHFLDVNSMPLFGTEEA